MTKRGVYPGSFNPPTKAHIAIARRAIDAHDLRELDIILSRQALGKDAVSHPEFEDRKTVLEQSVAHLKQASVKVTSLQLLSDIAEGYDLLILGGDKWRQIQEPKWYRDDIDLQRQLSRLPPLAVAERSTDDRSATIPSELLLDIDESLTLNVSSTAARSGDFEMMTEQAARFAATTGAWVDRSRYNAWRQAKEVRG